MSLGSPIDQLSRWLNDPEYTHSGIDHEDGAWVIASLFSYEELIPLVAMDHVVADRRDEIIYALVEQLVGLLTPNQSNEPHDDTSSADALRALTRFVRENWLEVRRIDREMGFGGDFDEYVVPHVLGATGGGA